MPGTHEPPSASGEGPASRGGAPPSSFPTTPAFEDRSLALDATPDQIARTCEVLASRTRLAVLSELIQSPQPLHINELARRVGVEASPVRMHLELLVKAGLAVEVESLGRERKFATSLRNVRLILIGAQRMRRAGWVAGSGPAADGEAERPKEVRKLEKKIASLEEDRGKIEARIRESFRELEEVWEHESRARGRNKS